METVIEGAEQYLNLEAISCLGSAAEGLTVVVVPAETSDLGGGGGGGGGH